MFEITGKFNSAKVFASEIDDMTNSQLINLLNQEFTKDSKIRIMADTHAGAGCVIGTTMTITDKVVPNLVGVDIGCGMHVSEINKTIKGEEGKLDKCIRRGVPAGFSVHSKPHLFVEKFNIISKLNSLICEDIINIDRAILSVGTLGGGNHFIEWNECPSDETNYLVIHSGSRNLGKQIAEHYQKIAIKSCGDSVLSNLAFLSGEEMNNYIHDMKIAQFYAEINRCAMAYTITRDMQLDINKQFTTIHNYIDFTNNILRKGAVSAQKGEELIIPINMRDGSLICIGKGNEDYNFSAPHGAGRTMSRGEAKRTIAIEDYKKSMEGIWSSCVNQSTIDESAFAYKKIEDIVNNIKDTVDIVKQIKPIYNFKSSGE
jgi:RNA-splicing ligase RtcB